MGKVAAGFFSLTEITDPTEHHRYNEWHQLDHLPEQLPLDGVVFGQRWVCTPACRSARAAISTELDPIHYLTLYLMAEPLDRTLSQFVALARRLRQEDRFHQHRRSHLSGPFELVDVQAASRVRISAEAVPYRPNRGLYVIIDRPARPDDASASDARTEQLLACDGVAGVWSFAARPTGAAEHWRPGDHRITVCFLDADPLEVAAAVRPLLAPWLEGDESAPVYAGPFETITPWQWQWFDREQNGNGH
jgi:hypothetical protein